MRILIYSYNYSPEPIGIAPLMTELAEGLVKRGYEVRVVTGMPNYPERIIHSKYKGKFFLTEKINGVTIQRSYIHVKPQPGVLARLMLDGSFIISSLWQLFNGWQPEVIFATIPPLLTPLPLSFYSFFCNCPIVFNIQDIVSQASIHVGLVKEDSWIIRLVQVVERMAYQNASKISVIAEGFIRKLVDQGVPKSKIIHIPNWVDLNFIKPGKKNNFFRTKHHLEGKFVVLYSGNIALTQGLKIVIKAAARLKHIPEIAFVIVGAKDALGDLEEYRKKQAAENVLLLPFVPREKLPEMLSAADIGLVVQKKNVTQFNLPSKIPIILASGRPIVASVPDTGTAMTVVKESNGGIVIPPEDDRALAETIVELYTNPDKVKKLGQQGRKYAEDNFGSKDALDDYERLFSTLVSPEKEIKSLKALTK
ncbi:MAG: glycosyltransferase family 4 protein [Microcoleaceae cyanobacterium]